MMRQRFTIIAWMALTLAFLAFHPVHADNAMPFQRRGVVDAFHPRQREIVINDRTYRLTPEISIYALTRRNLEQPPEKRKRLGLGAIREGMRIGFTTQHSTNARREQLVEIWILPRGTSHTEIGEQSKANLRQQKY